MKHLAIVLLFLTSFSVRAEEVYSTDPQDFTYLSDQVVMFHYNFEARDYFEVVTCDDQVFNQLTPIRMRCQAGLADTVNVYYIERDDLENVSYFKFVKEDSNGNPQVNSIIYYLYLDNGVRHAELVQYKGDDVFSSAFTAAVRSVAVNGPSKTDKQFGFAYSTLPILLSLEADSGRAVYNGPAGTLTIPNVIVGGTQYKVVMKKVGENLDFTVTSANKN